MRSFTIASVGLALLFGLANAQVDLTQLPACATQCAVTALGATGCQVTDPACVCSNSTFLSSVQSCIATACSEADQQATLQFAQDYCLTGGVTISVSGSPSTPPSAPASTASAAPTTVELTTSTEAPPTTTAAPGPATATESASPPSTFTGAANAMDRGWAMMGALALGAAAFV